MPDSTNPSDEGPRFVHPKVLAIDLPDEDVEEIRAGGFNVAPGSFGTPIEVERTENYAPININGRLPGVTEQQIVVVDLAGPPPNPELRVGNKPIGEGPWQQKNRGLIDPRPYFMWISRSHFERIYEHGGVFIIFAAHRISPDYVWAAEHQISYGQSMGLDNWSFLGVLDRLDVTYDLGTEITPAESTSPLFTPISTALAEARFDCLVDAKQGIAGRWATLARSKYDGSVAGILGPEDDSGQGFVIVLPRIERKGKLLRELLDGLLPHIAPKLFPEDERHAWVEDDRFASAEVARLRAEIVEVEAETGDRVAELERRIEELRHDDAHLRDLLTASGDELVAAVKQTLESLAFEKVVDVDVEEELKENRRREDLHLAGGSPIVLCEVKGINNLPSDEDALQVGKYVLPRINEWKRHDVHGLTVVNHQRGLPPADRDVNVFQGDQVQNAEGQGIGLLTTLDLYRLARGFARNDWPHHVIAPLFTEVAGRVDPVPANYEPIGEVVKFFENQGALTVQLDDGIDLAVGETVAYILPLDIVEEEVKGIQVSSVDVDPAPAGSNVGLLTALSKADARKGTKVYRVGSRD